MEEQFEADDAFLAKWLNGTLSESEMEAFKKTEAYEEFQSILEVVDNLTPPVANIEADLNTLKTSLKKKEKPSKRIPLRYRYAVAASITLLLLVLGYLMIIPQRQTEFASLDQAVAKQPLPDGSTIILNVGSEGSYAQSLFALNRRFKLNGEALFKVQKGARFVVQTGYGQVTVLGTSFNVNTYNGGLEVSCFTGKVKVATSGITEILEPGDAIRILENSIQHKWNFLSGLETTPGWTEGKTQYRVLSLKYVLEALERQYQVMISIDERVDQTETLTGAFDHNNLEKALNTVLGPLELDWIINQNRISIKKASIE